MASTVDDARNEARILFDGGEYERSLETSRRALADSPNDVELLILAGRAGVELDDQHAVEHLRRATELAPDDVNAWDQLGDALATEGRMEEAEAAFRHAVELDPEDQIALTHLGHTAVAAGRREEGVGYLARASDIAHAASSAAISLVDMYRSFGQYDDALEQARRVAEGTPDDALAWLDLGELNLQVGQLDDARSAFTRIRELDETPGHEAYPLHGLLLVELRRERWEQARQLVELLATIDPHGLSADVSTYVDQQSGAASEQAGLEQVQVEAALSSSLADYRRMLYDERNLSGGQIGG